MGESAALTPERLAEMRAAVQAEIDADKAMMAAPSDETAGAWLAAMMLHERVVKSADILALLDRAIAEESRDAQ